MVNVEINSNCSNKNKKRNKNEMATEIYRERESIWYIIWYVRNKHNWATELHPFKMEENKQTTNQTR